jgi:hypothetical protein
VSPGSICSTIVLTKPADDAGGVGAVPWNEVENNVTEWITGPRLPDPVKAPFKEPGRLRLEQGLAWLVHLSKRQNGAPTSEHLQWSRAYGSSKPPPSWSAAIQPIEQVPRGQRTVHLLKYDGYFERSQAAVPIPYAKETWLWLAHTKGEGDPSKGWMGLPCRVFLDAEPLIDRQEMEAMKNMFGEYYDEVKELVEELVTEVNEAEKFAPCEVSHSTSLILTPIRNGT